MMNDPTTPEELLRAAFAEKANAKLEADEARLRVIRPTDNLRAQ